VVAQELLLRIQQDTAVALMAEHPPYLERVLALLAPQEVALEAVITLVHPVRFPEGMAALVAVEHTIVAAERAHLVKEIMAALEGNLLDTALAEAVAGRVP